MEPRITTPEGLEFELTRVETRDGVRNGYRAVLEDGSSLAVFASEIEVKGPPISFGLAPIEGYAERDFASVTPYDRVWKATRHDGEDETVRVDEELTLGETMRLVHLLSGDSSAFAHHDPNGGSTWTELLMDREHAAGKRIRGLHCIEAFLRSQPGYARVFEEGFELETLGGGTLGFVKQDPDTGDIWTIACESDVFDQPYSPRWTVGREHQATGSLIQVGEADLDTVLDGYARIPAIDEDEDFEKTYPGWQEFAADHPAPAAP